MDAWTDGPQLLVGQSLGGLTAAAVAASRPDLVRELVVIDITPGIDSNAGPTQIREFFAGPTDWASRDELVERALAFGLGGSRRAAERGVYLNSRIRPDGRVEWKHHFAHLAAAMAAAPAPGRPCAGRAARTRSRPSSARPGWQDLAGVDRARSRSCAATAATSPKRMPRSSASACPTASVLTVPAGHNVQEELPTDLGRLLARPRREGLTLVLRSR